MKRHRQSRRRGVVLIMVTFAMFVLCGMLGLVVDLGWSYFVQKSAQSAADAAALAAVNGAKELATSLADYACGVKANCEPVPRYCSEISGGNLKAACDFAAMHGFLDSAEGRQRVSVQAYDRSGPPTVSENCGQSGAAVFRPPTAGCVDTYYWVTVRVVETIPQLFSAILGNSQGVVSARATASVAQSTIQGSLILINRENDPWKKGLDAGVDLYLGGGPEVTVPGGIIIASTAHGPGVPQDPWAGFISGNGVVDTVTSSTVFRGSGRYAISGGGQWVGQKTYGGEAEFDDPMRGQGQPPLTAASLPAKPLLGGVLDPARDCAGGDCGSAVYYAVGPDPTCRTCAPVATGAPIVIGDDVTFNGGQFGDFYFLGGLQIGQATVRFGPGRYGMFGVLDPERTILFNTDNRATLLSAPGNDAGRLFILSDTGYPGLTTHISSLPNRKMWGGANKDELYFSKSSIKAGNNAASRVELYGLNKDYLPMGEDVLREKFNSMMFWQDQGNSYVGYTPAGYVDTSCSGGDINYPCEGDAVPESDSPQFEIWATPYAHFEGTIYQPRGAWTLIQAAGDYIGPLRIISGAMQLQGNGKLTLAGVTPPIIRYAAALVE